ncbi:MAG: hypothetical protein ACRDTB_05175 [Actinophytocola sp.]
MEDLNVVPENLGLRRFGQSQHPADRGHESGFGEADGQPFAADGQLTWAERAEAGNGDVADDGYRAGEDVQATARPVTADGERAERRVWR